MLVAAGKSFRAPVTSSATSAGGSQEDRQSGHQLQWHVVAATRDPHPWNPEIVK
jgi:hypothetical protein